MGIIIGPIFDAKGFKVRTALYPCWSGIDAVQYLYPIGAAGSVASLVALSFTLPNQIWQQFLSQVSCLDSPQRNPPETVVGCPPWYIGRVRILPCLVTRWALLQSPTRSRYGDRRGREQRRRRLPPYYVHPSLQVHWVWYARCQVIQRHIDSSL